MADLLRFGLKLSQNVTIDQMRGPWRLADEAGFDSCWVMDHFATLGPRDDGPIFEAWTMLAAMAQLTTRTRFGCAVVGNTYRHPAVLVKIAVTVEGLPRRAEHIPRWSNCTGTLAPGKSRLASRSGVGRRFRNQMKSSGSASPHCSFRQADAEART